MNGKKLINDSDTVVDELVEGFVKANDNVRQLSGKTAVARKNAPFEGKVGLVIGGGAGHEPLFLEFIGPGMADAVAHGDIFAAPSPNVILEATEAADGGEGVLYLYGNYDGDIMNFDMAAEMAREKGIDVKTVRVWDDVASAPQDKLEDRRGIAGDLFMIKIAGAKTETGASLDEVESTVKKARKNIRTIGVALSSATLPGKSEPTFKLGEDEMEVGMGLHGEPGVERTKLKSAKETTNMMIGRILNEGIYEPEDEVNVLVNGLGSTTKMELLIVFKEIEKILDDRDIMIYDSEIGNYCTTQEMAGCSITLLKLDEELKTLHNRKANSPGYRFFRLDTK